HLSGLIRTQHGRFDSTTAVPLENLQESTTPKHYLQNPALFLELPILEITSETAIAALRNGVKVPVEEISPKHFKGNTVCYLKEQADVPVAVAQIVDKAFKPLKVFL
ncbi:MAG: hypothetical protein K2X66_08815, partial [Cyanobacteria bacterium]|nr:hypothetical protein [Cyanobacteriota bacterium]